MTEKLIQKIFASWEEKLAKIHGDLKEEDPFQYGLEKLGLLPSSDPLGQLKEYAVKIVCNSDALFSIAPIHDYKEQRNIVTFPSRLRTDFPENDLVHMCYHHKKNSNSVVLILPHWNADRQKNSGLSNIVLASGNSCAILSLPYHDERQPKQHSHAKGLVNSNLGWTIQSMIQATCDSIDAITWLSNQGYSRVILVGFSVGSCIASIVDAHDPRPYAVMQNLIAGNFGECVWWGNSTTHIRASLEAHIAAQDLSQIWSPISPATYIRHLPLKKRKKRLIVSGRYDLTFPYNIVEKYRGALARARIQHQWDEWPCGHYSLGRPPFSYWLGIKIFNFLKSLS